MNAFVAPIKKETLIIIGNGMVGHHCIEQLVEQGALAHYQVHVFGEERQRAYDRVHLSEYFGGRDAESLALCAADYYSEHGVHAHLHEAVLEIDREQQEVVTANGRIAYDKLILATGSYPFVPPIPGADGNSRLVYRRLVHAAVSWLAAACSGWKRLTHSSHWGWKRMWSSSRRD